MKNQELKPSSPVKKKKKRLIKMQYFVPGFTVFAVAVFAYFFIFHQLPSPQRLKSDDTVALASHILDRNGKLLYEIYRDEKRTPVRIAHLPKYVSQASIAIEDKDFYKHEGVAFVGGIGRAIKEAVADRDFRRIQGGSTITQQLVKSALLSSERTLRRKAREMVLAMWTEQIYTKDEILELYLNQIPYGGSAYGIQEAAKTYYNKDAKRLTIDEAALLAGLPQAPSLYSPFANPELAKIRRDEVLKKMFEQKYISSEQYRAARAKPVHAQAPRTTIKAPHFVFYIKNELEKQYGTKLVEEGGLKVTTTLDLTVQENTENIVNEELDEVKYLNVSNGAVLVMRPPTGEILAMVGSRDYFASASGAFNVTTALRQPGSSIKPLNYAVGIDRRLVTPATLFLDTRTCFPAPGKQYCPVNYDGTFHGPQSLRLSLGNSYNIPAVKMLALNGVKEFVASMSAFTITSFKNADNYGLSLTLGGGEVRMSEMAQAFSALANRGKPRTLKGVLKVEDRSGKVLYEFKDPNFTRDIRKALKQPDSFAIPGKRAVSQETAFIISHILQDNNARLQAFGSGSFLVIPRHSVSVKTGTTDDKKDNWTIGYTPNFLAAVWVGNNDNTPMNQALSSGVTGAAPIWNRIMRDLLKNQASMPPIRPAGVVGAQVCSTGGAPQPNPDGSPGSCATHFEYLIRGTEKTSSGLSSRKEQIWVTKDSDKMARQEDPNTELKEKTVMTDGFSRYCLDCTGDQAQPSPTQAP